MQVPEKVLKPICYSPTKSNGFSEAWRASAAYTGPQVQGRGWGCGHIKILSTQVSQEVLGSQFFFQWGLKETASWGWEGSSTNWCLKNTTNTNMLSRWIHSFCSWKPRNCLNFPNFLKQKNLCKGCQSPYYGPFSPSEGLQPLTIWPISIGFSFLFCKMVLASFSHMNSLWKQ